MRIFHELAFEGYVSTNTSSANYSLSHLDEKMGAVDMIHVSGFATQVIGTSPTLTVQIESSIDRHNWYSTASPIISAITVAPGQETLFQANDVNPYAFSKFRFVRLKMTMGGTSPQGRFCIWVTGRDWSRRSHDVAIGKACSGCSTGSSATKKPAAAS